MIRRALVAALLLAAAPAMAAPPVTPQGRRCRQGADRHLGTGAL